LIERPFERALEHLSEGVMLFDTQGNALYQNPASLRIHGYAQARLTREALAATWTGWDENGDLVPFERWPLARVLRGEWFEGQVLRARRTDTGHEFWARCDGQPIRDDQGRTVLNLLTVRDVTADMAAKAAATEQQQVLRQTQERLSLAQSITKSGIWDWDIPRGVLFWTPEMFELFGIEPGKGAPTFDTWRRLLHPEDIAPAEQRLHEAVQSRSPLHIEYRITRADDGQVRWILVHADTLVDNAGQPSRMLGLCLDITERKQLSDAVAQAAAASTAKSMFLATMSHELRTPLNAIIGFTTLVLERVTGEINAEQEHQLSIVKRSAHQLLDLITDILDVARVEAGKLKLDVSAVSVRAVLEEQVEAMRPAAEARGLALSVTHCPADLVVRADRARLGQVVRNLLSNAVKFTDEGSIAVSAALGDDGRTRIDVTDTGIGISPAELTLLFTPFRRSDDPRSASRGGTGLGLSISRSLIVAMGGSLTAESTHGSGSTFRIVLPQAPGEP
jgi:PAS domain S-box-containing protein